MLKRNLLTSMALAIILLLAACVAPAAGVPAQPVQETPASQPTQPATEPTPEPAATRPGMGPGFGRMNGMMERHHAQVPEEYADLRNPVPADVPSLDRGEAIYLKNCAACHGVSGMGDTELGQALDPPVAPIAHTGRMMNDGYLFWRISDGGIPFGTAMPAWGMALEEEDRWHLVNYIRSLGSEETAGRGAFAAQEAEHRAEMLAAAVDQGVITQDDAGFFDRVHGILDDQYGADRAGMDLMGPDGMQTMQRALTGQAVRDGHISQEEADRFTALHDLLIESGVME